MPNLVCVDVGYRGRDAIAAAVVFDCWDAAAPMEEIAVPVTNVEPYVPGQFYRRELPCILAVVAACKDQPDALIVDGYVWLGPGRSGLGAHVHKALHIPVIGVAKTRFQDAPAVELLRSTSIVPLFVTAEGIDPTLAADHIRTMHGTGRIPSLLRRVDRLSRSGL